MHRTTYASAAALAIFSISGAAAAQDAQLDPAPTLTPAPTAATSYDLAPSGGLIQAPSHAFELSVSAGYVQPFGDIRAGAPIGTDAGPGFSPGLELNYRFDPHWALGIGGQYHESSLHDAMPDGHVRGFATNVNATYHFLPYRFIDPYIQVGTGYRAFWLLPEGSNNNIAAHGFELGRIQVGADYRVAKDLAIGPYISGDVNMFMWEHAQNATVNAEINGKRVNTFMSAGILGRFDMGGTREPVARMSQIQQPYFEAKVLTPPPAPPSQIQEQVVTTASTGVYFESDILTQCGVTDKKAFFEFDSANLKGPDITSLDLVARCLSEGVLKGQNIVVVGRADPRGTEQYNKALGENRAEAVRTYLIGHGVPASTVETVSRGEKGATGTDESGWAFDRRVDIRLKH